MNLTWGYLHCLHFIEAETEAPRNSLENLNPDLREVVTFREVEGLAVWEGAVSVPGAPSSGDSTEVWSRAEDWEREEPGTKRAWEVWQAELCGAPARLGTWPRTQMTPEGGPLMARLQAWSAPSG